MKTKLFKHKLLAVCSAAALGLCIGGTALAGAKTYSSNEITFLIQPIDADGNNITLESLDFEADPETTASALKQPDIINPLKGITIDNPLISDSPFLLPADLSHVSDSEACVGILALGLNNNCKFDLPDTFEQQPIGIGNDFCRGKTDIPFIPPLDDPNLPVSEGAQANAITECQFDRDNDGLSSSDIDFSASIVIEPQEAGSSILFELRAIPFLEVLCHNDPLFAPKATAAMGFNISLVNDATQAEVFAFIPNGTIDPLAGQTADEATLNTSRFCDSRGDNKIYNPFNPPNAGLNDCTLGNDPDLCEYTAQSPGLEAGTYTLVVAMSHDSNAEKLMVPPDVVVDGDHFLCYKSFGHFLREEVRLDDQFEDKNFKVLKPKMFCNPAIKPVKDDLDPDDLPESPHYQSYKIKKGHRVERHVSRRAEVTNQFGTIIVDTIRPDRLMVPSGKSVVLPGVPTLVPPIPPAGPKTNHYKCYTVRADNFLQQDVVVKDQFTDQDGKNLTLVRPKRLCTPVEKTRIDDQGNESVTPIIEDPNNELDHLMCYMVRAARGEKLHKKTKVLSSNQFRNEDLVLKRELEFCVPSTKTLLP